MLGFDLLVYMALVGVIVVIIVAARVIKQTNDAADSETRKVRFAAATLTGLLMLILFSAVLWAADKDGTTGKAIFDKTFGAITPLVGVIIGYFFTSKDSS